MSIRDLTNAYSAVHPRYLLAKKPQIRTDDGYKTKNDETGHKLVGPLRYTNGTAQRSAARPRGPRPGTGVELEAR